MDETIKISKSTVISEIPDAVKIALQSQNRPVEVKDIPKYPSEPISLPSQGYFYPEGSALSAGIVDIKYMTAKEEDILASQNLIKKGIVLERLLESLIVTPGVKMDDILVGDKNALFIAARRLAYGDNYGPLEVQCRSCGAKKQETFDLSVVKNKEFDFSKYTKGQNRFEYMLPKAGKIITYKLLTHTDENAIEKEIEQLQKISKSGASSEVTTRLKRMILAIEGNTDRSIINKFVDNELTSKDSLAFRTYVRENTPNIDMGFNFKCDDCSHEEVMDIPLGVSFFWPNAGV